MNRKLIFFICALTFVLGCKGFRGVTFRTPSESMSPTIKPGDSVFADPVYYKHSPVKRGDIVVLVDPDGKKNSSDQTEMYVKRIVALGGDKVQVISAKLYVNDRLLDGVLGSGKYEADFPVEDFGPLIVPANQYFLVGDNLANSYDSRHWKRSTVTVAGIYGKVTTVKDGKTGEIRYLPD
jgi:signal peptidase I